MNRIAAVRASKGQRSVGAHNAVGISGGNQFLENTTKQNGERQNGDLKALSGRTTDAWRSFAFQKDNDMARSFFGKALPSETLHSVQQHIHSVTLNIILYNMPDDFLIFHPALNPDGIREIFCFLLSINYPDGQSMPFRPNSNQHFEFYHRKQSGISLLAVKNGTQRCIPEYNQRCRCFCLVTNLRPSNGYKTR